MLSNRIEGSHTHIIIVIPCPPRHFRHMDYVHSGRRDIGDDEAYKKSLVEVKKPIGNDCPTYFRRGFCEQLASDP